jgi:hypothetical protein
MGLSLERELKLAAIKVSADNLSKKDLIEWLSQMHLQNWLLQDMAGQLILGGFDDGQDDPMEISIFRIQ